MFSENGWASSDEHHAISLAVSSAEQLRTALVRYEMKILPSQYLDKNYIRVNLSSASLS